MVEVKFLALNLLLRVPQLRFSYTLSRKLVRLVTTKPKPLVYRIFMSYLPRSCIGFLGPCNCEWKETKNIWKQCSILNINHAWLRCTTTCFDYFCHRTRKPEQNLFSTLSSVKLNLSTLVLRPVPLPLLNLELNVPPGDPEVSIAFLFW